MEMAQNDARFSPPRKILIAIGLVLAGSYGLVVGDQISKNRSYNSTNPPPPIYADINGDGVPDKTTQRRVLRRGPLFSFYTLEDVALYGVELKNGKIAYITKEQFEELNK